MKSNTPLNLSQKLIQSHLISGNLTPGKEISLQIEQALLQDATGTLVMLELEAMNLKKAKTEVAVQYVDHNLLQTDFKNADDHIFLKTAAQKFGLWYSRAGNGVSHPVHFDRFGIPGKALVGSDSHSCAAGAMAMLSFGTGGLDVASVIAGEPYFVVMPKVMGVKLTGKLPNWVSAKDVILEMLRKHDVKGGKGYIIEYYGEGVKNLTALDRHVIANMGAELGATTTVFPSDEETLKFLKAQGRVNDWQELKADENATYDKYDEINLSKLVPLIACPSSPGNVVKVSEVEGKEISQAVIGSSANPGLRDFWIAGEIVYKKTISDNVSLDINPATRQIILNLTKLKSFAKLMSAGARFHQSGCMGCIGMGQAPASGKISLRTMPRNFPGRSGTLDDQVYLCSPETAAASALTGKITDPTKLTKLYNIEYPEFNMEHEEIINTQMLLAPTGDTNNLHIEKGPNIKSIPNFDELKENYTVPILLKMSDNISTDEILKAGADVLPLRSNIPEISKYAYNALDANFYDKAQEIKKQYGGHIVIAGENYAQGSSREHAALAPRFLGQIAVIAKSYARIGWQNLINFGIIPLEFENKSDYDSFNTHDTIEFENIKQTLLNKTEIIAVVNNKNKIKLKHNLSQRQINILIKGGVINYLKSNN